MSEDTLPGSIFSDDCTLICDILSTRDGGASLSGKRATVGGWVKTGRQQSSFAFLELNDGSCRANLQVIVSSAVAQEAGRQLSKLVLTGTCIAVFGTLTTPPPQGTKQKIELRVEQVKAVGPLPTDTKYAYPLPKTRLTLEQLREFPHLRVRTNTTAAITRIRSELAYATHAFFHEHKFVHIQTPIITASDCEGAGEMFQVTTLINEREKTEKELMESVPPSEADIEAAKLVVHEKVEDFQKLKLDTASIGDIVAATAVLTKATEDLAKLEDRAKHQPGLLIPNKGGKIDYSKDFFGRPAFLTVSGQLHAETYACGIGRVYTFGPTFRAEKSHTSRHLAEFWMVEPEIAFAGLEKAMDCAEMYVKFMCKWLLDHCLEDLEFMVKYLDKTAIDRLTMVAETTFKRITYTEAVELLEQVKDKKFVNKVEWGIDLASEHERYLTEVIYKKPVIVHDYPKGIKAFYMRLNDDGKTVAAMDVLVPKVGELVGGSQREDRYDVIVERMTEMGLPLESYKEYLDLRRFGTVKHSGFGLGFERMLLFATGIDNIRDVIPFPRTPGKADL